MPAALEPTDMRNESPSCAPFAGCRWMAALLVAAALSALAPATVRADAALDAYNAAVGLQREKRWDLAAEAFRKFLKDYPQHEKAPFAELYLGLTLINQEKYADARTVLRSFVKANPQSKNLPDAMYRVGESGYLLGEYPAAEADFLAFSKQFPKHELMEWALPYLGDAQLRQKKYDAAAESFKAALAQFPKGRMVDEARFGLARSYDGLKKDAEALALYQEIAADRQSPRAPQAQMQVGTRLYDSGRYADAATAFLNVEKAFPENPLVPSARMNAGYSYYQLGQFREAVARFEQASKEPKQAASANYWIGVCQQSLGEDAEAAAKFQAVVTADPMGPLAERALFQWAEMDLKAGRSDAARDRFLDLVKRFPKSELAPDGLHAAAESELRASRLDSAQKLLDQFAAAFPNHRLQSQQELLQARVFDARGDADSRRKAATLYESLLQPGKNPQSQNLARLYLARGLQKGGDHARAVEMLAPLVATALKAGEKEPSLDAVVLAGNSQLALKQGAKVVDMTTAALAIPAFAAGRDQLLSLRATALARDAKLPAAVADLDQLEKEFAASPAFAQAILDVAEAAYAGKDYTTSAAQFGRLAKRDPASSFHAAGLSGLAWSEFEAGKYAESAAHFADMVKTHPDDADRAPEAAFMQGLCFQKADQPDKAAAAYAAAWEKLAPKEPAAAGVELEGQKLYHAFRSGWKGAQLYGRLKQRPQAVKLFEAVARLFPQARDRDKVLDDWALVHYEAEEFDKADEIFRLIVKDYPTSPRADDARLNLAESDYLARRTEQARKEFAALAQSQTAGPSVKRRSLYNLAKINAELRDWKELLAVTGKFLAREDAGSDADRWHVEALAAEAHLNLGDAKAAFEPLKRVYAKKADLAKETWFPQVRVLLAEAQCQLKDYDAVAALVEEFRKEDPDSKILHRSEEVLGRAYKNQAKFSQARAQFERVVNDKNAFRTETAAKCQFLIGETYLLQKDYKTAQIEYFKVEQLYKYPDWQSYALLQVAKCDEALNQWKDAVKAYEDLLKKYPESQAALQAKGDLQAARKRLVGGT